MTWLDQQFPSFLIARRNLARTKLRSSLAALGIVIGVVAIASIGIFGASLQMAFLDGFGDIGDELIVSPAYEEGIQSLNQRDLNRIERAASDGDVMPIKQEQKQVVYGNEKTVATLYGISNPGISNEIAEGRMPRQLSDGALVGATIADSLELSAGSSITIGNETYRIHGILQEESEMSLMNMNSAIIVPPTTIEGDGYDRVLVKGESGEAANESAVEIRDSLTVRNQRVTITELSEVIDQVSSFFDILNTFLIGIGSISLVVAAVSILNVMLMSVVERRAEVSVMRAVGYRKREVLKIFLGEALILGIGGGLVGVTISFGVGLVISFVILNDPMSVLRLENFTYIVVAFAFGTLTSVLSGLYPAWKAANESPVEALRS